jgi:benzodiazapine receptor
MTKKIIKLVISLALPQIVGLLGSLVTAPQIATWYTQLNKPFFNPPNWIFSPVWITLFVLIGMAMYLIWEKGWDQRAVKVALIIFWGQLLLNLFWSILFFGQRSPHLAFIEIIILWVFIWFNLIIFYKLNKVAGWLFLPYLLWVSFAVVLNFSLWQIN